MICNFLSFGFQILGHYIQARWRSHRNRYNKGFQQRCHEVCLGTQALLYLPAFLVQKGCLNYSLLSL